MTTYPLTVRHELDDEWMGTLVEMAGYGIAYWAKRASHGAETYKVWWDDSGEHSKMVSYGAVARAVQRILDVDDTRLHIGPAARAMVAAAVLDPGDIDAVVADLVIQVADLGKVVYG
jgi:hypothetical protein